MKKIFFYVGVLLLAFVSLHINQVHAQSPDPLPGINLTVSPVFINLITDPGKETNSRIKITNNSNINEQLKIRLVKFKASADGSQPQIEDVSNDDEFKSWISFSKDAFSLAPNETKTISFTINPPKSAALGYYYAVVFQRAEEEISGKMQTLVSGAPAVSILLEVKSPKAKRELQILDFNTDKLFYEYLPAQFKVQIKNTGNIHIIPVGNIFIDWGQKKDVAILTFNEGRGNSLPNTERVYTVNWDDGMIVRKDGKTRWDFTKADRFRIGRYIAKVLVVYDDGQRDIPLEAQVAFWIIPWKIVGVALLIIVLVMLGLKSTFTSSVRRLRRKKKK